MKIKVNLSKETISIKGLTPLEFSVIEALLNHVRMGQDYDGGASEVPFDFSIAIDEVAEDLSALNMPEVTVCAVPSEESNSISIMLCDPTLELHAE
jgi:hypothetical protein